MIIPINSVKKLVNLTAMSMVCMTLAACQSATAVQKNNAVQDTRHPAAKSLFVTAQSQCLQQSQYKKPRVSGQIIETPRYLLVTLMNNAAKSATGELCIVNKSTQHIEITPVNKLRFLTGIQK